MIKPNHLTIIDKKVVASLKNADVDPCNCIVEWVEIGNDTPESYPPAGFVLIRDVEITCNQGGSHNIKIYWD